MGLNRRKKTMTEQDCWEIINRITQKGELEETLSTAEVERILVCIQFILLERRIEAF